MIYETLSQPTALIILAITGFIAGFLFDFSKLISFFCEKSKIALHIFQFISTLLAFFIYTYTNLLCYYGRVRFFSLLIFFGFLILQRLSLGNIFAKIMRKWYNHIEKSIRRIKETINGRKKNKKD